MNTFLYSPLVRKYYRLLLVFSTLGILATGCEIFAPPPPIGAFTPKLAWLRTTRDFFMDVDPFSGVVVSVGGGSESNNIHGTSYNAFTGDILGDEQEGKASVRDVLADDFPTASKFTYVADARGTYVSRVSVLSGRKISWATNPYKRYNTAFGRELNDSDPSVFTELIQPSLARGPGHGKRLDETSAWMVGTFTDRFKPQHASGYTGGVYTQDNTCPTLGKADCFIVRYASYRAGIVWGVPVHHQWGGPEHDLAYDVASDTLGNPTIFLRAGSDFAITSATQSMVKMNVGYNIVRLDTNGLLTETFPVRLQAQGEITNVKIALAPPNIVYITAKDEQRKQYFLAKVTPNGTEWTRYFHQNVSTGVTYLYSTYSSFDLAVDKKANVYLTGSLYETTDFGNGYVAKSNGITSIFVAKYSATNECLGAMPIGTGTGMTIRLSPEESAVYISGLGTGSILGAQIIDPNDNLPTRDRVFQSPAFLVKLWVR